MADEDEGGDSYSDVESLIQELRRQAARVSDPHIRAQLDAIAGEWERLVRRRADRRP